MGSAPSQPAPPLKTPDVVRPGKEAPAKRDFPKRRSPMVHVGLGTIKIILKSMTDVKADVIVIPSSAEPLINAICNAAGESVRAEYLERSKSGSHSKLITLLPGTLKCKRIYIVTWQPGEDRTKLEKSIKDFVHESIQSAVSYHCTSIAFPAIGCSGNNSFTSIVIPAMVRCIKDELLHIGAVLRVIIAILPHRQPIFEAFEGELNRLNAALVTANRSNLPHNWSHPKGDEKRFVVSVGSNEHRDVCAKFDATMTGHYQQIVMIERIQNKHWYLQDMIHSDDFRERLHADTEKRLFHGCSEESANQIIKSWFNRAFAGIHAQAVYSHRYAVANPKREKRMFPVRVLIGKTTSGSPSMKVPPVGYDSTTDGNHIYVTYHDAQAYSEYLIAYR